MYKNVNSIGFDEILKTAFTEYVFSQYKKEPTKEELIEKYPLPKREMRTAKKFSKKVKYGKPLIVVYLQRACIIALVCLCTFFATISINADGENIWKITKEVYMSLEEKVEHVFGSTTVNKISDVRKYDSLSDLKENEDLNGALLPLSLEGKYDFANASFSDYGESQTIMFDIKYDNNKIGHVNIKTSYNGNYNGDGFVNIGRFDVKLSHYGNVHQFEFVYDGNFYRVKADNYDILLEITESLE